MDVLQTLVLLALMGAFLYGLVVSPSYRATVGKAVLALLKLAFVLVTLGFGLGLLRALGMGPHRDD